jgi:hypothetical protein
MELDRVHMIEIAQQAIDVSIRRRGRVQPFDAIESRKTALLVVDMQGGFVAPGNRRSTPRCSTICISPPLSWNRARWQSRIDSGRWRSRSSPAAARLTVADG